MADNVETGSRRAWPAATVATGLSWSAASFGCRSRRARDRDEYAAINSAIDELIPARVAAGGAGHHGSYWFGVACGRLHAVIFTFSLVLTGVFGVDAEEKPLEEIAEPLSAEDAAS